MFTASKGLFAPKYIYIQIEGDSIDPRATRDNLEQVTLYFASLNK